MKFFTAKEWRQHLAEHREALDVARNNKPTDYEREQLKRYRKALDKLWARHSKPYPSGQLGDTHYGQEWWCSGCRTQWPCKDARLVMEANGVGFDYLPLRLPIRGEKREKGAIRVGGTWMSVQGVEPDGCSGCAADAKAKPA